MKAAQVQRRFIKPLSLKNRLPFQKMLAEVPLQLIRLHDFSVESAYLPHRHAFFMLLWTTKGSGLHRINFRDYELSPGRVFFSHEGHVHQMLQYPDDGWMIIFQQGLFRQYIERHSIDQDRGLFDFFTRIPYVELDARGAGIFKAMIRLMAEEVKTDPFSKCLIHNLSVLLCQANRLHGYIHSPLEDTLGSMTLRKFNALVNENFRLHRKPSFYSTHLGLPTRKLNELTKQATGKLVNQLISDRLLSESEYLLGGTIQTMKEIIFELGFADHAHFAVFIRKHKGLSPTVLRKQLHDLHTKDASR